MLMIQNAAKTVYSGAFTFTWWSQVFCLPINSVEIGGEVDLMCSPSKVCNKQAEETGRETVTDFIT